MKMYSTEGEAVMTAVKFISIATLGSDMAKEQVARMAKAMDEVRDEIIKELGKKDAFLISILFLAFCLEGEMKRFGEMPELQKALHSLANATRASERN